MLNEIVERAIQPAYALLPASTEWFAMELTLPRGRGPWPFQFRTICSGPDMMGGPVGQRWVVEAELTQCLRAK